MISVLRISDLFSNALVIPDHFSATNKVCACIQVVFLCSKYEETCNLFLFFECVLINFVDTIFIFCVAEEMVADEKTLCAATKILAVSRFHLSFLFFSRL